ncbi:hypothetical protein TOPH_06321 [Tolypocladium ophioglossoides CBS 100239]|uniref:Uncharacterized protein n=1 Tax=Tolypocladium ophioglossoides (strain CBS 100239) TaxID=1163406 RepID=A0A0L0N511_TOLOC|nr:hypothetical protein TOPH_06321 [Tolypocladium ophioglossoides CBS 100239]
MHIAFLALCAAGAGGLAVPVPVPVPAVAKLDQQALDEAQQRDGSATRAFSNVPIRTAAGQCLFVDRLSGDFRANLTPIQMADCDASAGQAWDVITAGRHIDQPGQMLVVSALMQACFNFDPRRPPGSQVLLFSCGGRADGAGCVTDSQLFAFGGGAGPSSFLPRNGPGLCLASRGGRLDVAPCKNGTAEQSFSFGA